MKSRLPRERQASLSTAERDEEGENHGRRREGDRDIPRDEQEGSPPEKMHYGWSPPEVEHSVAA